MPVFVFVLKRKQGFTTDIAVKIVVFICVFGSWLAIFEIMTIRTRFHQILAMALLVVEPQRFTIKLHYLNLDKFTRSLGIADCLDWFRPIKRRDHMVTDFFRSQDLIRERQA
jgi:hypothetical protein